MYLILITLCDLCHYIRILHISVKIKKNYKNQQNIQKTNICQHLIKYNIKKNSLNKDKCKENNGQKNIISLLKEFSILRLNYTVYCLSASPFIFLASYLFDKK